MKRLILVRHGESIWNAERRIQGQSCAGLSPRGHAQAAAVAVALAATHPDARLVTSDLQRTRETVAPLEAALGRDAELDPRLRERSFGAWEQRLREDVAREDADRWRRWLAGRDVVAEVGGESAEELADRVAPVLRELLTTTAEGGVTVAVTHGGPVWQGLHRVLGLAPGTFGGVDNASFHELLTYDDEGPIVLDRWNGTGHVPVHLRSEWVPGVSDRALGASTGAATGAATSGATVDAPPVGR